MTLATSQNGRLKIPALGQTAPAKETQQHTSWGCANVDRPGPTCHANKAPRAADQDQPRLRVGTPETTNRSQY
eukprot:8240617-Lingulodinium_polyedra.AAC.1